MMMTNANHAYITMSEADGKAGNYLSDEIYIRSYEGIRFAMEFEVYEPTKGKNPFTSHPNIINILRERIKDTSVKNLVEFELIQAEHEYQSFGQFGLLAAIALNDDGIHGILFLYCSSKTSLNETERFGLRIIANQAATAIRTSRLISDERALNLANLSIRDAAKAIVAQNNLNDMFFAIVEQAQKIVSAPLAFVARVNYLNDKNQHQINFAAAWPDHHLSRLLSDIGEFNIDSGNLKAAYKGRFGITGIAVRENTIILLRSVPKPIRENKLRLLEAEKLPQIAEEIDDSKVRAWLTQCEFTSEEIADFLKRPLREQFYLLHYIPYNERYKGAISTTESEFIVPIAIDEKQKGKAKEARVIATLNLEHHRPNAFSDAEQNAIISLAEQAAVAIQKVQYIAEINQQKERLRGLQQAMHTIASAELSTEELLYRIADYTCDSTDAHSVVILLAGDIVDNISKPNASKNKDTANTKDHIMKLNKVYPSFDLRHIKTTIEARDKEEEDSISYLVVKENNSHAIQILDISDKADTDDKIFWLNIEREPIIKKKANRRLKNLAKREDMPTRSALCLPLQSQHINIGVLWLHFSHTSEECLDDETYATYRLYADQVAVAYHNAKRTEHLQLELEKEERELKSKLDKDYEQAQKE